MEYPFEVRLTRDVQAYHNLLIPADTPGTVLDFIGSDEKNPDGYFVEIKVLWNDKETTEVIEVPMDGFKKARAKVERKEVAEA